MAARRRAAEIGESCETFTAGVLLAVARLRELAEQTSTSVEVYLYDLLPTCQRHGVGTLSFWAVQRDNGACPGTQGAGACSGLDQPTWFFSHVFEPFTR